MLTFAVEVEEKEKPHDELVVMPQLTVEASGRLTGFEVETNLNGTAYIEVCMWICGSLGVTHCTLTNET